MERWDFWLLKVLPLVMFFLGCLMDFFRKDSLKLWYKNYLPLFIGAPFLIPFHFFPDIFLFGTVFYSVNLLMALWLLRLNWKNWGLNIFSAGMFLNMLVCLLNGNQMPALAGFDSRSKFHQLLTPETYLPFLADIIEIGGYFITVGDLLMIGGSVIFAL